jgi:hypothetical protein
MAFPQFIFCIYFDFYFTSVGIILDDVPEEKHEI